MYFGHPCIRSFLKICFSNHAHHFILNLYFVFSLYSQSTIKMRLSSISPHSLCTKHVASWLAHTKCNTPISLISKNLRTLRKLSVTAELRTSREDDRRCKAEEELQWPDSQRNSWLQTEHHGGRDLVELWDVAIRKLFPRRVDAVMLMLMVTLFFFFF